ncbi:hypothetical protein M9978_22675 [Sphingomonas sp. MG17]|uniref:Uncharacterized protein n=1 Tax=Sphingomonas tagetis TaxID=2949092 RepID=A0A9X2KRX0_9SPHN|nr:hypothetical protein [Sphingomonas tagetis]MCP3733213.1 hypothetical protein [Sphingomonas tagetis]
MAELQGQQGSMPGNKPSPERMPATPAVALGGNITQANRRPQQSVRQFAGADFDTAKTIAARFGLNLKSYRQRLRDSISWYCEPQDWTFRVDSTEWRHDRGCGKNGTLSVSLAVAVRFGEGERTWRCVYRPEATGRLQCA